ncbi:hypothetical protein [Euzebya pacifica]|uniref:hypothetical protein n=1 Tax=Euzebya pacifica TaxID=1608957 RepID=UPI0030F6C270
MVEVDVGGIVDAAITSADAADWAGDPSPLSARRVRGRFQWDSWPRLHDPELVAGPGALPFAWVATATSTAVNDGFPVHAVGAEEDVRHLVLVALAHAEVAIPVLDLIDGRIGHADWPRLSRQAGRVVSLLTGTVADQPLTISPWLPTGRRTIGVAPPGKETVDLVIDGDTVLANGRAVGTADRPTMRIVP